MKLIVSADISLEIIDHKHAKGIYEVVSNNQQHLGAWLPWVPHMKTLSNFQDFVIACKQRYKAKMEVPFVILFQQKVAGRIGLYNIDHHNKIASVGYWIGKEFEGNGIVTASCKAVINYGFNSINLHRIELKCGTENYKSKAIAERLDFKQEGIARQAEFVNNNFIDLYLFALLKHDKNG